MTDTITAAELRREQAEAMPERELQEQVRQIALANGWRFYHTWDSRKSAAGFPDCLMLRDGRMIVAELKREGKEPTDAQFEWLDDFWRVAANVANTLGTGNGDFDWPVDVKLWRPSDLLDGTIHRILEAT